MKNVKGITLIALIITIIVLLILAGVSISLVVGNNGVLTQATNAVEANRKASAKEDVEMAWAGATTKYWSNWANDSSKVNNLEFYQTELQGKDTSGGIINSISESGIKGKYEVSYTANDQNKTYTFIMNEDGKVSPATKWKVEEDGTISGNVQGVQIGDYINYDCYTGVDSEDLYYKTSLPKSLSNSDVQDREFQVSESEKTRKWKIFGVDESGRLLITSSDIVLTKKGENFFMYSLSCHKNGPDELDNMSAIYGHGEGALSARSINVEDINKMQGYEVPAPIKYTYTKSSEDGKIRRSKYSGSSNQSTYYYWDSTWQSHTLSSGETSPEIEHTYYTYQINTNNLSTKAYNMLKYKDSTYTSLNYWLASSCINCYGNYASYNIRYFYGGTITAGAGYESYGRAQGGDWCGIRPVVTLSSSVMLEGDSTNGWTIK